MELETTRFGRLTVDADAVLTFTHPIIGFQERRFVLLPGPPGNILKWLQSVENPALAFLLMDPRAVVPDYAPQLPDADLVELGAADMSALTVYTLVVAPPDRSQVRTNLKAPIVVHGAVRLAKQTILEKSDYPVQYFLDPARRDPGAPKEVAHARSDA